jgi:uncharacterized membrane protein
MSSEANNRQSAARRQPVAVGWTPTRATTLMRRWEAFINHHATILLWGVIIGYIVVFTIASSLKLAWFRQGFDMAGNEQVIWNTLHGRLFQTSVFAFMQYDFDDGPVLLELPLALLYGIYPSPYTLLALQTAALGLAAWPIYLLGRDILGAPWQALALALIYLLHPTTQHINMYEFQLRAFLIPFALGALLFLRREQLGAYLLCLFLMLCTKTEAGFVLLAFGVYALLLRRRWPFVVVPLLAGPAWVAIALGVIVPRFSQGNFITEIYSYGVLGNSIGDVIWTLLTNPLLLLKTITTSPKLLFVGSLLGLQALLALLSPIALLALPILMMNLISPNAVQFSLNYQYPALIYPFLIVAAADGLVRLTTWLRPDHQRRGQLQRIGVLLLLAIAIGGNLWLNNAILSLARNHEPAERVADANAIVRLTPPGVALAASSFLAPHLAQREELFFFPGNRSYPRSYVEERADYLVADRKPPSGNKEERALLESYLKSPDWILFAQRGDFVLLRRSH